MRLATANPDGSIWIEPNTKKFVDAVSDIQEAFDRAALMYAQRGGFKENGTTQLDKIRSRRVQI